MAVVQTGAIGAEYKLNVLAFLLVLIIAEMIWSWKNDKKVYQLQETLTNTFVLIGFQISKLVFASYQLVILGFAASLSLFTFKENAAVFILTFFLADFVYYWFHRALHMYKPLWAFHHIHHSASHMNLSAAYRLNWFAALISPLFFVPLALLGLPPTFIVVSYTLNLLYQFFLHTEVVDKLGIIEGIIDTPSAHRAHHGSNDIYLDKNFGGVLMIWDRIFKTYQPEIEKVIYGVKGETPSNNPFQLVFGEFVQLFKK